MENENLDTREELVKQLLNSTQDSNINDELIKDLVNGKISEDINKAHTEDATLGDRVADKIASFGGSWKFIIGFITCLVLWILLNTIILMDKSFDPYPFTFLNLVLSCIAAIQAPIIMMSQNRQAKKDRMTASNDYIINLKDEIITEDIFYKLEVLTEQQAKNTEMIESALEIIKNELEQK